MPSQKKTGLVAHWPGARLVNAISQRTLYARRDAAMIGLVLGCGLRRAETVSLRLDQLQSRQNHWVIVDMRGKGGRLRTVPLPMWCKSLIDAWLRGSGVMKGKVFRRVSKNGNRQDDGVKTDVVWYAVKPFRLANSSATLEVSIEKLRRLARYADDLVRCLAVEFEIELGFRLAVVPAGKLFEFAASQGPLCECGPFDGDAHARRLSGDTAFLCDCFGGSDDATRDEALPALVLACEDEHRVTFGDVLAAIHRLLRSKRECLRPQSADLSFNRECHAC